MRDWDCESVPRPLADWLGETSWEALDVGDGVDVGLGVCDGLGIWDRLWDCVGDGVYMPEALSVIVDEPVSTELRDPERVCVSVGEGEIVLL